MGVGIGVLFFKEAMPPKIVGTVALVIGLVMVGAA